MSEWKEYTFTEVATLTNGRAYLQPELQDSGKYRIVRVGNLSGGDKWFYSDMELPDNKYCNKGDLLYAWACSFGPYIWNDEKTIYHYHIWKVDVNDNVADKIFLYYYLMYYTPKWMGLTNGSVMMHITKGSLEKQKICLPHLETQHRIASILSSLDDKIAVNRRICENLEAQAQALFKHWFIDFAPFKDGKFVDSELGMIPEGWKVGRLEDICAYSNEKVAVGSLNEKSYFSTENMLPNKAGAEDASSLPQVEMTTSCMPFDVLVSNIRPYFKKIIRVSKRCGCSTDVLCFHPNKSKYNSFLYRLLYDDSFFAYAMSGSKGTKMPRGDKSQIMRYPIVLPIDTALVDYSKIAEPMFELAASLKQESSRLSTLRDTLLPKLMSGQIKV